MPNHKDILDESLVEKPPKTIATSLIYRWQVLFLFFVVIITIAHILGWDTVENYTEQERGYYPPFMLILGTSFLYVWVYSHHNYSGLISILVFFLPALIHPIWILYMFDYVQVAQQLAQTSPTLMAILFSFIPFCVINEIVLFVGQLPDVRDDFEQD